MSKTSIEWTDMSWTPLRAKVKEDAAGIAKNKGYSSLVQIAKKMVGRIGQHCEHVSPGCERCYSETNNGRCLPHNGTGLPFDRRSRDLIDPYLDEKILMQPLHWRKPRRIFVCSQTDLFGEWWPEKWLDRMFAVMEPCPRHTFQVLTKRAERMYRYWSHPQRASRIEDQLDYLATYKPSLELSEAELPYLPLECVHLGVSVENQPTKDRIDWLRKTPAAVRWLSLEPLLEDLGTLDLTGIDWVVVGGESGPGARPCDLAWIRSVRDQCKAAGCAFFCKQLGSNPHDRTANVGYAPGVADGTYNIRWKLKSRKGGDISEWPEDLRLRQEPVR